MSSALIEAIQEARSIALISHVNPDGDAVGSVVGLHLALQDMGKMVWSTLVDGVPEAFHFLPNSNVIKTELAPVRGTDLCIVVDTNDAARTGRLEQIQQFAQNNCLAVLDHHPKGDLLKMSKAAFHNTEASSASEMVYELLSNLEVKLTPAISTALLMGMYTDTGGFQFPNTSTWTLEVAAELMRRGGRLDKIVRYLSHSKTVPGLKLLGMALDRLKMTCDGRCAVSVITYRDMVEMGATPDDLAGIVGEMNVLPEAHFCLLLTEPAPGMIRGALRTGEGYRTNVSTLAKLLGGGGHPRASGFTVKGNIIPSDNGWELLV